MRHKHSGPPPRDDEERRVTKEIGDFLGSEQRQESAPPLSYWSNLTARTNQRLDEVTSGKALSISWAARVAIPGVVAIICFFIGLHYYVPERPSDQASLLEMVDSLPVEARDSLFLQVLGLAAKSGLPMTYEEGNALRGDDITEYLLEKDRSSAVLETMSEEQVDGLLDLLRTRQFVKPL